MYLTYSPKYFARKDYDGRFSPKPQLSAINQKSFEHDCKKRFSKEVSLVKNFGVILIQRRI